MPISNTRTVELLRLAAEPAEAQFPPRVRLARGRSWSARQSTTVLSPPPHSGGYIYFLLCEQGLAGFKGRVTLRLGDTLGDNFRTAEEVATEVDRQVVGNLELYSINYWALSRIREDSYREAWLKVKDTVEIGDVEFYEARLKECNESDRDQWLKMYANPVLNKLKLAMPNPELTGETAWLSRKW